MAGKTPIEWTDSNWNPIRGCSRVSEGCRNCYAEGMAARFSGEGNWGEGLAAFVTRPGGKREARWTGKLVQAPEAVLTAPLRWKAPRMIFVNSTSDLFHEAVPDEWIDLVFAVMALCPQHIFQVLTKRPERMREYVAKLPGRQEGDPNWPANPLERLAHDMFEDLDWDGDPAATRACEAVQDWPLPNVWLGTSVEDQASADARIPHLLETPAAIRFISAEPLLGPVDLMRCGGGTQWIGGQRGCGGTHRHRGRIGETIHGVVHDTDPQERHHHHDERCKLGLDWVICGGESGPGARPMHPDWARSLRDQCANADVPFFFKQWGAWADHTDVHAQCQRCKASTDRVFLPDGEVVGAGYKGCGMVEGDWRERGAAWMCRVEKKAAGRLLDGVTHDAMPGAAVPRVEAAP